MNWGTKRLIMKLSSHLGMTEEKVVDLAVYDMAIRNEVAGVKVEWQAEAQRRGYGNNLNEQAERGATYLKVLAWRMMGRVGMSSNAMAEHLFGERKLCDGSYPHDPDDLNRCLLFLDAVPEARAEMTRMATVNKTWAALVERWGEIEESFLSEAGSDWCKAKSAPNTYRLMREVIDAANGSILAKPTTTPAGRAEGER